MEEVIQEYLAESAEGSAQSSPVDPTSAPGDDVIRLRSVACKRPASGTPQRTLDPRQPFSVEIEYVVFKPTARSSYWLQVDLSGRHCRLHGP